jgi:hypothetical protein
MQGRTTCGKVYCTNILFPLTQIFVAHKIIIDTIRCVKTALHNWAGVQASLEVSRERPKRVIIEIHNSIKNDSTPRFARTLSYDFNGY